MQTFWTGALEVEGSATVLGVDRDLESDSLKICQSNGFQNKSASAHSSIIHEVNGLQRLAIALLVGLL